MKTFVFLVCLGFLSLAQGNIEDLASRAAESFSAHVGKNGKVLQDLFELDEDKILVPKSRQKRLISIPFDAFFQMKWNIDIPFTTFSRWNIVQQISFLSHLQYPAEIFAHPKGPTFAELLPEKIRDKIREKDLQYAIEPYNQYSRHKRAAQADRHSVYTVVQSLIERMGLPARECFLRFVCEVAEIPFHEDLLGLMINTVFSPSRGGEDSEDEEYLHFLSAENHGRRNGSCDVQYSVCPLSVLDAMPYFKREIYTK